MSTRGGHLYVGGGQAVHDWWTLVRVAATKSAAAGAVRVAATNVYELQPLGLHNKFTNLCNFHKKFKKFFYFLVILRIDFFEKL